MAQLNLKDVTLVSICGNEHFLQKTIDAAQFCLKDIEFKETIILSNKEFKLDNIKCIKINSLNKEEYSHFCLYELPKYIETEYCLTFQWDGFIINPSLWTEEFYSYDYIGAPWIGNKNNNVGNGGFSLRSQKFLQSAKTLSYNSKIQFQPHVPAGELVTPEDWFVCNHEYETMRNLGVKFADVSLAYKFSVEHPSIFKFFNRQDVSTYNSFGFHGQFNVAAMALLENL
jgi:hypothetical protein